MRDLTRILLVSTIYIGSVFVVTQGKTFRLDSDYDSNLPIIAYVVDTIRNEKHVPLWNPYVRTGISVLGDPLSGVTYLPYLLPMLAFGVPDGWWVVVWLHVFGAGVAMWMLLGEIASPRQLAGTRNDVSRKNFWLPLWGGLLYMGAGAFAARVAAGHVEKVLSYPWYPVFLLFLIRSLHRNFERLLRRKNGLAMTNSAMLGAIMGVVFLTGDIYGLLFMAIFYVVVRVIRGIREIGEIGVVMVAFVVVAGVKLVPFLLEVAPVMTRYSTFDPAKGSIHAFLAWIPFVMPWGVEFYDRPVFQRLLGFWYNWYEYYAFIGLPMVFLYWLPKAIKRRETQILLLLLGVGLAYIARGYAYSPWFGLAPLLEWFRTPQRMYGALTSVVAALIVLSAHYFIRPPLAKSQGVALKKQALLWGMLLITFLVSGYQMTKAFEPPRLSEAAAARAVRSGQTGELSITTSACCMQLFLIREKVRVINYYYGWIPKEP